MALYLHGISAAQWWQVATELEPKNKLAHKGCPAPSESRDPQSVLSKSNPSCKEVNDFLARFPDISAPLELSVSEARALSSTSVYRTHLQSVVLPMRSFLQIDSNTRVAAPELTYLQMARRRSVLECVFLGSMLCSGYRLDRSQPMGLAERAPLTTKQKIMSYLDFFPHYRGVAHARNCLPYVMEDAASPKEILLAMRLLLPGKFGGFGLPHAILNYRIDISKRSQRMSDVNYYVADMCWPAKRLVVEYDSDIHATPRQLTHDAIRRNTLEEEGWRVITVTKFQLADPLALRSVAVKIARALGVRLRTQAKHHGARQALLFTFQGLPYLQLQ